MTPNSPTWGDVKAFLAADEWRQFPSNERGGRRAKHIFYEKVLEGGRTLETHASHSDDKTVSAGRFSEILRTQLEVNRAEFWECIRSGKPVNRPVTVDQAPVEHDAWVIRVLVSELHMTTEQIAPLSREEAIDLVQKHWQQG